jgi:hypothetical protein
MSVDEQPSLSSLNQATDTPVSIVAGHESAPRSNESREQQRGPQVQEQSTFAPNQISTPSRQMENSRTAVSSISTETSTSSASTMVLRERGFLLMCVNTGKYMTELSHIETTYLGNDYVLFSNIRANYEALRGAALKPYSLYHPTSARLVRVSLSFPMSADSLLKIIVRISASKRTKRVIRWGYQSPFATST